jgi:hypothetical protein
MWYHYCILTCSRFLISKHVLQQAYEIPGYFHHTKFFKVRKFRRKIPKNFVWETAEKRLNKRRSNAPLSLPLNLVPSDFVLASAPCLSLAGKKAHHIFHRLPKLPTLWTHFSAVWWETPEKRLVLSTYMGYGVVGRKSLHHLGGGTMLEVG